MSRGFIKPVGGNMRMRMVKPGYDANNMSTPPNQVIFDSEDLGTLSVLYSGVYRFFYPATPAPVTQKIVSWDLPYVPLCTFQFRSALATTWSSSFNVRTTTPYQSIIVDTTGITVTFNPGPDYADIRYQAYRLVVV